MGTHQETIQTALALVQAGKRAEARDALKGVILDERDNPLAWAAMVQAAESDQEKAFCLKQVLRLRPGDPWASRRLKELEPAQASSTPPPSTMPTPQAASDQHAGPEPPAPPQPGMPPKRDALSASTPPLPAPARPGPTSSRRTVDAESLRIYRATLIGGAVVAVLVVIGLIYGVYQEYYATSPADQKQALQVAREWTEAQDKLEFDTLRRLSCEAYSGDWSAGAVDPVSAMFAKGLQSKFEKGIKAAYDVVNKDARPKAYTYEIGDIHGSTAHVRVAGFMSDMRELAPYMDEETYRAMDQKLYIMKRAGGQWKWCGYQEE